MPAPVAPPAAVPPPDSTPPAARVFRAAAPAPRLRPLGTPAAPARPAAESAGAKPAAAPPVADTPVGPRASKHTVPPSVASRRPDLFAPEPVYPSRDNYYVIGAADLRYRALTRNSETISGTPGFYIAAARVTGEYIRANPAGEERGGVRFQALLEPLRPDGTALNKLRVSEAYGFYRFRFPGVSATLRGGQFVLPFGLIATYDTPLQPIQPLYEKALGLRVDTGLMLEGDYGPYHYAASVTTGAGPNRSDPDSNKVIAFRLSRTLETRLGLFQVGGSLLTGRLPKTGFETVLLPSGTVVPQLVAGPDGRDIIQTIAYTNKTRFAADGEYRYGRWAARGEVVFGGEDDEETQDPVWGFFAEGNYRLTSRANAVAYVRRWNFPVEPQRATTLGAGADLSLRGGVVLRALYEFQRDVPPLGADRGGPTIIRRLTLQTRVSF